MKITAVYFVTPADIPALRVAIPALFEITEHHQVSRVVLVHSAEDPVRDTAVGDLRNAVGRKSKELRAVRMSGGDDLEALQHICRKLDLAGVLKIWANTLVTDLKWLASNPCTPEPAAYWISKEKIDEDLKDEKPCESVLTFTGDDIAGQMTKALVERSVGKWKWQEDAESKL